MMTEALKSRNSTRTGRKSKVYFGVCYMYFYCQCSKFNNGKLHSTKRNFAVFSTYTI